MTLQAYQNLIQDWIQLRDPRVIEVLISAYIANLIKGKPVWLFLVGSGRKGKSALLSILDTSQTKIIRSLFDSNLILANGSLAPLINLLNQMKHQGQNILIVRSLSSIFNGSLMNLQITIHDLLDIYEGEIERPQGRKRLRWKGRIGLIAGFITAIDIYNEIINTLGGRVLQWRLDPPVKLLPRKDIKMKDQEVLNLLSEATNQFLRTLNLRTPINLNPQTSKYIQTLSKLITLSRLLPPSLYRPITPSIDETIEGYSQSLTQFLKGLLIVRGKSSPTKEELEILTQISKDTIPSIRLKVLKALYERGDSWSSTSELSEDIDLLKSITYCQCSEFVLQGLLDRKEEESETFRWRFKDSILEDIEKTRFF